MKLFRCISLLLTAALLLSGVGVADVITNTSVNLRSGPGTSYRLITTIPKDVHLEHLDEKTDKNGKITWYQVKYKGQKGWIYAEYAQDDGIDRSLAAAYDLSKLPEFTELSEMFGQNLAESAEKFGLNGYLELNGEIEKKYFDAHLTFGGSDTVDLIALFGGEYTLFGVAPGMKDSEAAQILCDAGLALTDVNESSMAFGYNANPSADGFNSCIELNVTEDIVVGVVWSLYLD